MKKLLLIPCLTLLSTINASSQIEFDLADSKTKVESIDVDLSPVVVFKSIVNREDYHYTFEIEFIEREVPPIHLADSLLYLKGAMTQAFDDALEAFQNATEESQMPNLYDRLDKETNKLDPKVYADKVKLGREALESSTYSKPLGFGLRNNQEITITVTRKFKKDNKDTSVVWVRTFKTPEKTPWSLMYGFTFVPNLMNPATHYYCVEDTISNTYKITPLNNQNKLFFRNLSPTIMITWTPMSKYRFRKKTWGRAIFSNNLYQFGFTAGLSMNFNSDVGGLTAMVAPSFVIARNVSLSFGACMTPKHMLKGKYKEGEYVKENLDFDQLHEKQYMGEWFLSLAIRFDENPFGKKEADKKD